MRKTLLIGTLLLSSVSIDVSAFEINVTEPGTFRELMIDTEEDVSTLSVVGTLNAADVEYLTGNTGKITQVKHLDISGIKLVESETEPYRRFSIYSEAGGGEFAVCYYSQNSRIETKSSVGGLGMPVLTYYIYGTDMAGLLADTGFEKVTLPSSVSCVGDYLCMRAFNLKEVVLPGNIDRIGDMAFRQTQLTDIDIPSGVMEIGDEAFEWTPLTSVYLPESVTTVGSGAFNSCKNLAAINLENVREIGKAAFMGDNNLRSLDLGKAVSIGYSAFLDCPLNELKFSSSLRTIEDRAFYLEWAELKKYSSLTELVLPEGLESIGESSFMNTNLQKVNVPSSVAYIGVDAFRNTPWDGSLSGTAVENVVYLGNVAYKLVGRPESVSFREGTTSIAANVDFSNVKSFSLPNSCKSFYAAQGFDNIENADLGSGLVIIGDNCFHGAGKLTSITLPESLEVIGSGAFFSAGLTSLTLPEGLKRIEDSGWNGFSYTFGEMPIPSIMLPEGLEYIGRNSFWGCKSLSTVRFNCCNVEAGGYYDDGRGQYSVPGLFGSNVEKIIIGKEVEKIPPGIFAWNYNLARIEFEDSDVPLEIGDLGLSGIYGKNTLVRGSIDRVTSIGTYGMEHLAFPEGTDLDFPNLKSLGEKALNGISGARSISLGASVESIGPEALAGAAGLTTLRFDVPDVKKPESYKWDYMLMPNVELDSIVIGRNVVNIPESFFSNASCNTLVFEPRESTRASSSLSIGTGAFYYNRNLYCVDFPSDLAEIGDRAFGDCYKLTTVYFHSPEAPSLGTDAIYRTATVYVPAESESDYKAMMPRNDVKPYKLESIVFDKSVLALTPGESDYLLPRISPAECSEMGLIWSTSDPSVATVNERGDVTGVNYGQATVTATIAFDNTFKAECIVNVYDPDGVETIEAGEASPVCGYYDLDGVRIEKPSAPGIYIAKHKDGSVSKILIK
ncbi:MAG: leucine-rich repeat protein [Muribaculaceae bacterium]|nr:leucine-rich repeat protein [Muribaculaceae bacterium]